MLKILVPVDGSDASGRAVDHLVKKLGWFKGPVEIHLLNVQPPIPYGGRVSAVIGQDKLAQYHQEEGMIALKPGMQILETARVKFHHHIGVGDAAEIICKYAKEKDCDQIVMGTRGMGSGFRHSSLRESRPPTEPQKIFMSGILTNRSRYGILLSMSSRYPR